MIQTLPRSSLLAGLSVLGGGIAVSFAGGGAADRMTVGLVVVTIGLWATGAIPESLTALAFFTLAMLARIAPPEVVFSGLMSSSFWLIFSGLVLGAAVKRSGLGDRIAARLAASLRRSYGGALAGVVLFGVVMSFIVPSAMGRIALMLPILAALAAHLGHVKGEPGHTGLMLAGIFGTYLPSSAILPANVPNNVLAGIVEATLGQPLTFGDYFLLHFPVLGAAKAVMLVIVLRLLYRGRNHPQPAAEPAPMSAAERRLSVLLGVALILWSTDGWHHISPAWVGMGAALVCLWPTSGLLPAKALQTINLEPLFFVAAIIGLGAVVAHAGLGQKVADMSLPVLGLSPDHPLTGFLRLCGLPAAVGLVTTLPGVPAVLTPLTGAIATAAGLPATAVLAAQVVGFSTLVLPYQAPPMVMALQAGDLSRRDMTRLCLITAALSILLLWPLDLVWLVEIGRL